MARRRHPGAYVVAMAAAMAAAMSAAAGMPIVVRKRGRGNRQKNCNATSERSHARRHLLEAPDGLAATSVETLPRRARAARRSRFVSSLRHFGEERGIDRAFADLPRR